MAGAGDCKQTEECKKLDTRERIIFACSPTIAGNTGPMRKLVVSRQAALLGEQIDSERSNGPVIIGVPLGVTESHRNL